MRLSPAIVIGAFALAACGERDPAPTPAEKVSAEVKTSDGVQTAPKVLTVGELRRVCRAGLAQIHGQTPSAITLDGVQDGVLRASWRAPVDGGRMRAECRVENDLIVWKPLDLPDATLVRWMNQSGDPVIRYVMDGETITITQTLPDGTTERADLAVPAEEEAR
ncbi:MULTISPECIES: hypothetical protein [unclassified Brevundimonas]|uniref:hypothetical protein n=1 Tax=unclassified Brevundimonas TaxID=2622653 RepID=UPI000E8B2EE7|nr:MULTISPECIES: hypothetical protein [unclassified Brevundimonas]MCK6102992.1 hypothetical protein [Brevundimonas sp. EYE_349]HBI20639.1 hypothetical protein [Brevundimonas sp.]